MGIKFSDYRVLMERAGSRESGVRERSGEGREFHRARISGPEQNWLLFIPDPRLPIPGRSLFLPLPRATALPDAPIGSRVPPMRRREWVLVQWAPFQRVTTGRSGRQTGARSESPDGPVPAEA